MWTKSFLILFLILKISTIYCSFQEMIFAEINKDFKGKNLIISPLSIYQVLSLTSNGAKGSTLKEMLEVLGSEDLAQLNDINYDILERFKYYETIEFANGVMSKYTPIDEFVEISEKYLAPIEKLKSVEQVNNWCSEKTHGKIKEIIKELDPKIVMILLNAIYFKGEWFSKFPTTDTKKKPFYNFNDKENEVEIDTMVQDQFFYYYEDSKVQAFSKDYIQDYMSAIIILPSEEVDINDYIKSLNTNNTLINIIDNLDRKYLRLELPKFEVDFSSSLVDVLYDLGMKKAFKDADFSGMREEGGLYISDVIHKTYLKVTEDGTEAAAVTIVEMEESAKPEPTPLKVNRPFLFLLRNSNFPSGHQLVFMSKIEELK